MTTELQAAAAEIALIDTVLCYKGECRKPGDKVTITWLEYVELMARADSINTKSGVYATRTDKEIE